MLSAITIRQEGERVLLVVNGRLAADMPWDAALEVAKFLHQKAKLAEEHAKANQIIYDSAILLRVGFPIGLSNNRAIQKEAGKEAAWNQKLRRYLPGGVKSQEAVGTPTIIRHKLKKDKDNG